MTSTAYEIIPYRSEFRSDVVTLLGDLWGDEPVINQSYFQWKYEENPNADTPLGVVALYQGNVVGFRGFFATKWHLPPKNLNMVILSPGDTCVHPEHRSKRLSIAMGNQAMTQYASEYRVFLNLSATKNSVPGYLRMGFVPLADKAYLTRYSLPGLTRFLWTANEKSELCAGNVTLGDFDEVIVTDKPLPEEMAAIVSGQVYQDARIRLLEEESFFRWRFNNKKNKYLFYFCRKHDTIAGFVIIRVSKNSRRGYIIDSAPNDGKTVGKILRFITEKRHFDILSVYQFTPDQNYLKILKSINFKKNSLMRMIEKRVSGEWPLLVRPVLMEAKEKDWLIEGLDIRKIDNWEIKEVCSDSA